MDVRVDESSLQAMRERKGKWAAYQNVDLSSSGAGHVQFLKYGPGCTHETPPSQMPDTEHGLGWRYLFAGYVNLATGEVSKEEQKLEEGS